MPDTRTAVATQQDAQAAKQANLARYIENLGPQLARVMSSKQQTDRLVRIAVSAARGNSRMLEATPLSVAGSLMTAAVLGLEPNTPAGECYLVPYRNRGVTEAQLIVGYQGYVKLYRQHPLAGDIYAEAVYPEDDFSYQRGTDPRIEHVPHPERRAEDSKPTHYYAVAILVNGAKPWVVLTADEVKVLRNGKEGTSGDIADPQRWMERKTALRQLVKLLPKSATLALAAQVDEQDGTALYAQRVKSERLQDPIGGVDVAPPSEDAAAAMLTDGGDWPAVAAPGGTVEDPPAGGEGL